MFALPLVRSHCEKEQFCNDMACECDLQSPCEIILGLRDLNGHVDELTDSFEGVHG